MRDFLNIIFYERQGRSKKCRVGRKEERLRELRGEEGKKNEREGKEIQPVFIILYLCNHLSNDLAPL